MSDDKQPKERYIIYHQGDYFYADNPKDKRFLEARLVTIDSKKTIPEKFREAPWDDDVTREKDIENTEDEVNKMAKKTFAKKSTDKK